MESLTAIDAKPWEEAIAAVKNNLRLPEERRAKNRTEIYTNYRFDLLQLIIINNVNPNSNIKWPKEVVRLIGKYMMK